MALCEESHRFQPRKRLVDRLRECSDNFFGYGRKLGRIVIRNVEEDFLVRPEFRRIVGMRCRQQ